MSPRESFFTSEDWSRLAGALLLLGSIVATNYVGLILHELGHLVCAWAIGWQPIRVTIGHGTPLYSREVGGVTIAFGPRIFSGSVKAFPLTRPHLRTKCFLFAASGPLI